MNFNSQICTSRSQSERLLALGLKKETADMYITNISSKGINNTDDWQIGSIPYCNAVSILNNQGLQLEKTAWSIIPAWSLHRLIEMLNYQVINNGKKYEPVIAIDGMAYQDVCGDDPIVGWSGDLYTDIIDCIEWLIKEGYFNKEYLEQLCGK